LRKKELDEEEKKLVIPLVASRSPSFLDPSFVYSTLAACWHLMPNPTPPLLLLILVYQEEALVKRQRDDIMMQAQSRMLERMRVDLED
jgi:hypothetical protein